MANLRIGRRSGLVLRGGRNRRATVWIGDVPALTTVAANTAVLLTSLNAAALALRPFTIVRVRGVIQWGSDQEAASETPFGAYGETVVSDQASAIGVTAVPTPTTDANSDLFLYYQTLVFALHVTPAGTGPGYQQYNLDGKAMRKVNDDQDLVTSVENNSAVGATIVVSSRLLVKIH